MNDQRTTSAIYSLWWQIALGVFIALCANSLVEAAVARYQLQQIGKQLNAEAQSISRQTRQRVKSSAPEVLPLQPGQRCIQGRRFERVDNGWRQLNSPC